LGTGWGRGLGQKRSAKAGVLREFVVFTVVSSALWHIGGNGRGGEARWGRQSCTISVLREREGRIWGGKTNHLIIVRRVKGKRGLGKEGKE